MCDGDSHNIASVVHEIDSVVSFADTLAFIRISFYSLHASHMMCNELCLVQL